MKLDSCPSHCTKISSNWIKDFNVSPSTKNARGSAGETLEDVVMSAFSEKKKDSNNLGIIRNDKLNLKVSAQ